MEAFVDLLTDSESVSGRWLITALIVVGAVLIGLGLRALLRWRVKDPLTRYHSRKIGGYVLWLAALIGIGVVWRPFAGQLGLVVGLLGAGLAFALQEVIGAIAGWANINSGKLFGVGDRIEMGGVHGDVIDISLLRTKLMEIGTPEDPKNWVKGRQYTGRVVSISNKKTFTEALYNYSAPFDYIWEELQIPIPHQTEWQRAEEIMLDEARTVSRSEGAQEAIRIMLHRYPVPRVEVEPHVFVRVTDNWMELTARFIVPVRTARVAKDMLTRRILHRMAEAGIEVASETLEATVKFKG